MNILIAKKIISHLIDHYHVQTFCVCSGSRNIPLLEVLSQMKGLNIFSFFEERSAGFFALGVCRREKKPVTVITTSGTAVAELLPAVIEAYYAYLPLVALTADRPSRLRGTGAPQTIQQVGIFSHYVETICDWEHHVDWKNFKWSQNRPCHINVCFDEPLLPTTSIEKTNHLKNCTPEVTTDCTHWMQSFFSKVHKPLVILSEIPIEQQKNTQEVLFHLKQPIYAEALSGLRESKKLNPFILKSGDSLLNMLADRQIIDGVIRIGHIPCTRFWRDLDVRYSNIPVLSVSHRPDRGLDRKQPVVSFSHFFKYLSEFDQKLSSNWKKLFKKDKELTHFLEHLLKKYPLSEWNLMRCFSQQISPASLLFLGNSLPIREWNLCAVYEDKQLKYTANRGANGIDGLLSSFLGESQVNGCNWCLLGDLSCLYDLSAPWILKQMLRKQNCLIGIINNFGAGIFSSLSCGSAQSLLLNHHQMKFKYWAKLWGLNYYCISHPPSLADFCFQSPAVIEWQVKNQQTQQIRSEWQNWLKTRPD